MSSKPNLFDRLSPAAAFASKLFAAASLDFPALYAAGDDQALKTRLEAATADPAVKTAVEQAVAQVQAELAPAAETSVAFTATCSALGITLPTDASLADQLKSATTPEARQQVRATAYKQALSDHIASATAALAAQQCTPPVDGTPVPSPAKQTPAPSNLTGIDRTAAAFAKRKN